MCGDILVYVGDHFPKYISIKSLYCIPIICLLYLNKIVYIYIYVIETENF